MDRVQRVQRRLAARYRLLVAARSAQALLAIFRRPMAAALQLLLRRPPLPPLRPRLSAQRTVTGTTPTRVALSILFTADKTSLARLTTLHTAARPPPTRFSRAWLSVTSILLAWQPLPMARAAIFSALSLARRASRVLWLQSRYLAPQTMFRQSLSASTR